MKCIALLILASLWPLAGLRADLSPSAQVSPPGQVSAKAVATPKPLWVDYQAPDWSKAKEHIGLEQAKKWSTNHSVLFCDARSKTEYDQGHIPGAIPLPAGEFDKYYNLHLWRIQKAKKLVTYCHGVGCRLSEKSANSLVDHGYSNVAVFFGGWPQWQQHNLPVESGDPYASDVALVTPTAVPAPSAAPEMNASPKSLSGASK